MSEARKFIALDQGRFMVVPPVLEEEKTNEVSKKVISIIGIQSIGKSTLLNDLIGEKIFHVEEDRGKALEATTTGIDLFIREDIIYLDVEGCSGREQGRNIEAELKLFAIVVPVSDCILIPIKANDYTTRGGFFSNFLGTLFFNTIGDQRERRHLVVVVNDKKADDRIKEGIMEAVRNK